jgi:hypothetical protein
MAHAVVATVVLEVVVVAVLNTHTKQLEGSVYICVSVVSSSSNETTAAAYVF